VYDGNSTIYLWGEIPCDALAENESHGRLTVHSPILSLVCLCRWLLHIHHCRWSMSTSTYRWLWLAGLATTNNAASYVSPSPGSAVGMGGRTGHQVWWSGDKIYAFSGVRPSTGEYANDLWSYSPSASVDQFTFIRGSTAMDTPSANTVANYNTKGTPTSSAWPICHAYAATTTDSAGRLWMLGQRGRRSNASF
jgi:hypothetical protein